jgi:glutamate-5-semialdehyde dehydrogenase
MKTSIQHQLKKLREASHTLALCSDKTIDAVLKSLAVELVAQTQKILKANQVDLRKLNEADPKYDRLLLTSGRIIEMANGLRALTKLQNPIGEVLEKKTLPNKLRVERIRVPLGVIGIIYEARPNVTTDAFGIAFKTKNAVALKGGSDATTTNQALVSIIQKILQQHGLPRECVYLLPAERAAVDVLLSASDFVDVIIPRGSAALIKYVRENSLVPVIETGAGVVHTYFDFAGDVEIGSRIILSAKTRRPSVCNALDALLIHAQRIQDLPKLVAKLASKKVTIYADPKSFKILSGVYPKELLQKAQKEHFGKEFLSLALSIKTVGSLDEALRHIALYSSKHSEAIITADVKTAERFLREVDAACVYHNTETGFSDGGELGLGAEIGISTQKLHARGPMGLREMTSYKWVIHGSGQTRMKLT